MSVRVSASGRRFFFGGCEVSWPSESLFGETSRSSLIMAKRRAAPASRVNGHVVSRHGAHIPRQMLYRLRPWSPGPTQATRRDHHQRCTAAAGHAQAKPGDIGGFTGEPRPSPSGLAGRGSIRRCVDPHQSNVRVSLCVLSFPLFRVVCAHGECGHKNRMQREWFFLPD